MPSHYDATKNCRVGTMDESQFYKEAEKENGACFRTMLAVSPPAPNTINPPPQSLGSRFPGGR